MHVVAFAAKKGGVGKTLLTASMSVVASNRRASGRWSRPRKVAIIDLDPQGCLTEWRNRRSAVAPAIAQTAPAELADRLEALSRSGTSLVFIDTPPGHEAILLQVLRVADLVVIPIKPSELDVAAALRTATAARAIGVPYVFLPNGAPFRSRAMGAAIRHLDAHGLPAVPPIHQRVGLMLENGTTGMERQPDSVGAHEIKRAWRALEAILAEIRCD